MATVVFIPTVDGFVTSVNEYLTNFKELNEPNAKEIVEHLKNMLHPLNIKIAYEHLSCLDTRTKLVSQVPGIQARFRFVLSTNRHKANFQESLVRQANGLICQISQGDTLICKVLSTSPNDFNPRFTHDSLSRALRSYSYDFYEINDGTTVNLYWDPQHIKQETTTKLVDEKLTTFKNYTLGAWVYGTKNAIIVDDMVWRGCTYRQVIDDVLAQYPEFSYAKLDKTKSYSFGFKHPAFHPFGQPAVWENTHFTESAGIGWLKSAWMINSESIGFPHQQKIAELDVSTMFSKAERATSDFLKNPKNIFLGYIIRSRNDSETLELSDILIESTLWSEIRGAIYQLPFIKNKNIREKQEQNFKNMTYVVLESFLDFRKRNMFITLFPQFGDYYTRYNTLVTQIVDRVIGKTENPKNPTVDILFTRLGEIVNLTYNTSKSGKNDKKVIRHLICHPKYTDIYFNAITRPSAQ
jgi:hypothetical protein